MNEIERLRELRAGLPSARPESRAAARAGLLARIEHAERPARPKASAWRSRRLRLAVAGVALAALLVVLPLALVGGGGSVQPAVAQVLHRAAEVAAEQEPLDPRSDQFVYTRSESAYLNGSQEWSVLVPSVSESWISLDGSRKGRIRSVTGQARFISENQRAGWIAAGRPSLPEEGAVGDTTISGGGGIIDTEDLPTDPPVLREQIEARAIPGVEGPPGEAETFVLIGDMLRSGYLPPAVRAALYEVTAELPGVELLGKVKDPAGRLGVGIAYVDDKDRTRHELILDPETSALLGERESLVGSKDSNAFKASPGTTIGYAAYLESRVVDSVGKNPPQGAGAPETSNGCYGEPSLGAQSMAVKHGIDPIVTCAKLWREGVVGDRPGKAPPPLVACVKAGAYVAYVFPSSDPDLCTRLNLVPFDPSWRRE